ncbi:MAG: tRNA lysidine(34) synthetase TilS [Candidatus Electryoneaceae bacterium]|nr:tRNA lysidine(34) synthetase TilS [Candidatus Electryoneaceae bacterium]
MDQLHNSFVKKDNLIAPGDLVIVAISGGADSITLLDLMYRLRQERDDFELIAAHFNHRIRPEADDEQRQVEQFCRQIGVELHIGSDDVNRFAQDQDISIHTAARELQYRFLLETSHNHPHNGRNLIATGHHRDDQIETVLMRLFSGAGVEGLSGIRQSEKWLDSSRAGSSERTGQSDDVIVIRPLISFDHEQIEEYCRQRELPFATDASNFDLRYPRNRIRHQIIPIIKQQFGQGALSGIVRSSELMNLASQMLSEQMQTVWNKVVYGGSSGDNHTNHEIILDYGAFCSYLTMLRMRILQRSAELVADPWSRITFKRLQVADQYIIAGQHKSDSAGSYGHPVGMIELGDGVNVCCDRERIYVYRTLKPGQIGSFYGDWSVDFRLDGSLDDHKSVDIPGYGRIEMSIIVRATNDSKITMEDAVGASKWCRFGSLICDRDKIGTDSLLVRPARRGDRIIPFGGVHECKVSDLLRQACVPYHRRGYPVIQAQDQIIAIPPFRIAESVKVTSATQQFVVIRWIPPDGPVQ